MKFDFHCHTNCSDGTLSPEQLLSLAFDRNIEALAITDHDTVSAYERYPPGEIRSSQDNEKSLKLISGCEFSALWNDRLIHIVGLDFDLDNQDVLALLKEAVVLREERSKSIADALEKCGIENALEGAKKYTASGMVGRPHFARYLVEIGAVPNEKKAFKKYLGKGKAGDIRVEWPSLERVVQAITSAGGVSIIAHPIHYDLTRTKLLKLVEDFQQAGGGGIEVISGKQTPNQVQQLVEIANQRNMLSSAGSDFHRPNQPWADLGKIADLPKTANPVWTDCKSIQSQS